MGAPVCVKRLTPGYLLRLTTSAISSSVVVMIREFAWNPLWAVIMLTNSWARSTLLSSRVFAAMAPSPEVPGALTIGGPDPVDSP